jgi:hypothetical protein
LLAGEGFYLLRGKRSSQGIGQAIAILAPIDKKTLILEIKDADRQISDLSIGIFNFDCYT